MRCRGVEISEVSRIDYAVCRADRNLGDRAGYMGWEASRGNRWYSGGRGPASGTPSSSATRWCRPSRVPSSCGTWTEKGGMGRSGLENHVYAGREWPRGLLFRVVDGIAYLAGVDRGSQREGGPFGWITRDHTVNTGGGLLGRLITYGRKHWAPWMSDLGGSSVVSGSILDMVALWARMVSKPAGCEPCMGKMRDKFRRRP